MRTALLALVSVAVLCIGTRSPAAKEPAPPAPLRFRFQEIDKSLKVGYAVLLADLNGDGKKDIVVVDTTRVIWFENPAWKMRTIIQGQTKPDNVCIDAYDIDGDGQLDLALGAEWKPFNTNDGGTLQWLRRGKTLDEPWTVYPIDTEPTVHRIRFADLDGDGRAELLVGPLMGRGSTREMNWMDGSPVRLLTYQIPKDPVKDRWTPQVIDESLHVMHNFQPIDVNGDGQLDVLTATYEGVNLLMKRGKAWGRAHIGEGNQENLKGNRGASEIKLGRLKDGGRYIATIEPWHGHQVVGYTPPPSGSRMRRWLRQVIDDQLKWGHAVWCADLDGDGDEELIIGVRDALNAQVRFGVNVYRCLDGKGSKWQKEVIDSGGVAVEDLAAADLDNDGRIDLVAVGRATGNVRIYWNETGK